MEAYKIKKFVDKVILDRLAIYGYDGTRQHLYDNILKNREIVQLKLNNSSFKYELPNIEKLENGRIQYLAYYVLYGERRIVDLFQIENKLRKYKPELAFKALLFKEKVS